MDDDPTGFHGQNPLTIFAVLLGLSVLSFGQIGQFGQHTGDSFYKLFFCVRLLREDSRLCYDDSMQENFKLTPNEYASMQQITLSALRKRRLSGKLNGQYTLIEGRYMYASPRPSNDSVTGKPRSVSRKRRRNVPNHLTKYPCSKFKQANDLKQLARIKNLLTENQIEYLTPDIIDLAKERHQQHLQERLQQTQPPAIRKYTAGIYNAKDAQPNYQPIKYQDEIEDEEREFWR